MLGATDAPASVRMRCMCSSTSWRQLLNVRAASGVEFTWQHRR